MIPKRSANGAQTTSVHTLSSCRERYSGPFNDTLTAKYCTTMEAYDLAGDSVLQYEAMEEINDVIRRRIGR